MADQKQLRMPPELVPHRLADFEESDDGRITLLVPRFRRGLLARWLQPRLKRPHVRLNLDEVGSFVWRLCDGERSLGQIVAALVEEFGEEVKPAAERLALFIRQLHRGKLLRLMQPVSSEARPVSRG